MALKKTESTIDPQERDYQILQMLGRVGYMNAPQLTALFWRAERGGDLGVEVAARRRLKQLREAGLIRVLRQWVLLGAGTKPLVYALDRAGALLVSMRFGVDEYPIQWKQTSFEENFLFLRHLMFSNDLGVGLTVACAKQGFTLDWLHELQLRRQQMRDYVKLNVQGKGGAQEEKRIMVVPDNFFVINTGRRGQFLAEIDCGTESHARWKLKIQGYSEYHRNGTYQKRFHGQNFRLLTVTTTSERLLHLKQATEEVAPQDTRFYFTTFDQVVERQPARYSYQPEGTDKKKVFYKMVYNTELLTEPLWYRSGDTTLHSLLE